MPIFEYQCEKCGHVFEHFIFGESGSDPRTCPKCAASGAKKIVSSFASFLNPEGGCGSGGCGGGTKGFS